MSSLTATSGPTGGIAPNPLEEARGLDTLSELFSRNPESLSEDDLKRMIEELRSFRERLRLAEAQAPKRTRKTPGKSLDSSEPAPASLEDILNSPFKG